MLVWFCFFLRQGLTLAKAGLKLGVIVSPYLSNKAHC